MISILLIMEKDTFTNILCDVFLSSIKGTSEIVLQVHRTKPYILMVNHVFNYDYNLDLFDY